MRVVLCGRLARGQNSDAETLETYRPLHRPPQALFPRDASISSTRCIYGLVPKTRLRPLRSSGNRQNKENAKQLPVTVSHLFLVAQESQQLLRRGLHLATDTAVWQRLYGPVNANLDRIKFEKPRKNQAPIYRRPK
jgi:hypothetical protein